MTRRVLSAAVLLMMAVCARAADVPRYHLPVGSQVVYSWHIENVIGERSTSFDGRWEFTVLKDNPDGSKHIAAIKGQSMTSTVNGQSRSSAESITRGYFEMKLDGQMKMSPTLLPAFNPQIMFPRLPASVDELSKGWTGLFERSNVTTKFAPQADEGGQHVWVGDETGAYHTINQRTDKWTYHFDPAKGLVTKINAENGQTYGSEQKGSAEFVLEREEQLSEEDLKKWAEEHDGFVKVYEKVDDLLRKAMAGAADADDVFQQARQALTEGAGSATLDPVKADFADAGNRAEGVARTIKSTNARIESLKGQPAPDWTLVDQAGQTHKLADQRGKIVVLDFIKRNANQAAYTVPQIQKLAEKYKDKPVVFFGMTDDGDEADTKMIIDALALKWPMLKLEGPVNEYGVTGWPASVVIDQRGNIKTVLQGYSKSRGQDVGDAIEELLKTPAQ
jgi:peroxiredoxin